MNTHRAEEDRRICGIINERTGLSVKSIFDFVNAKTTPRLAIPVMVQCLPSVKEKWIKEGMVRALSIKDARGLADEVMIEQFNAIDSGATGLQGLKWSIGNALSVIATNSIAGELIEITKDRKHGKAREMAVVALGNISDARAIDTLIELLNDEEVCGHAAIALGKLRAKNAVNALKRLSDHPKPWVRKEVEKALSKIRRADGDDEPMGAGCK
jgi:hypothetical protein